MNRHLILACAGAGKSHLIAQQALEKSEKGQSILLLTYTDNNQKELLTKICELNGGVKPTSILIKGWFAFLLQDMIRPYQTCIFKKRIPSIYFNDAVPHKRNGRNIPGRKEIKNDGSYNPVYYLTKTENKAHTTYLSKLAHKIYKESKGKTTQRLAGIFDAVLVDEVQDLVGWDFEIIKAISQSACPEFTCVGDFRQTIYSTSIASKRPKSNTEKLEKFLEIGFSKEHMNENRRCIQPICTFADLIHSDEYYPPTVSRIKHVDKEFLNHQGVFAIQECDVRNYLRQYKPVILKSNKNTRIELCEGRTSYNFGVAKGLGFDRVLILPTDKYITFLEGSSTTFKADKTEEAKNKLYVAVTRARYSVAFIHDGKIGLEGIHTWSG